MKRRVVVLSFFLSTAFPVYGAASQQRPSHETWYERVLRQINPDDTDYGAIWEERKKAFADRLGSPYFQYCLATTVTILWLFIVLYAQHVSHRRKEDIAVDAIADVLRHDAYSREKAREVFRRYPKPAYMTEIESWRELPDGRIEFTMRRLPTAD